MKKKIWIPVLCLIAIAAVAVVLCVVGEKTVPLSLTDFYNGEEYVYASTAWGMSVEEVEKALPVRMIADTSRGTNTNGVDFYTAKKHFVLDGYEAEITIELEQKNLNIVKFTFETDDAYQAWFDTQLSALIALYGDDYDYRKNSNAQYESSIYKWETEDSSLQLIMLTGEKIKPAITLGVTKK